MAVAVTVKVVDAEDGTVSQSRTYGVMRKPEASIEFVEAVQKRWLKLVEEKGMALTKLEFDVIELHTAEPTAALDFAEEASF